MKILSILVIILLATFLYFKSIISSIKFNYKFDEIGFNDIGSFFKGESFINVKAKFILKFTSFFSINISELKINLYDRGELVASTSNDQNNLRKITLLKNVVNNIDYSFNIRITAQTLGIILKIKEKLPFIIDYQLSFKILGLTIKYKNKYEQN